MKILFDIHLCPREFGSAVFNVPDLLKWAKEKGFHLATVPPLDDYDFAQAEYVLSLIANSPLHSTADEAAAHVATNPMLAQHPAAGAGDQWLAGAYAGEQWRAVFSKAIANGELVLLDRYSFLPVAIAAAPAKGATLPDTNPSGDDVEEQAPVADDPDHDETLAALFDPLPVEALEKMFPADGKWTAWAEKAAANGLKAAAKEARGKFNPYKAGVWFIRKGWAGWDDARLYRKLRSSLPARSRDKAHLFGGDLD